MELKELQDALSEVEGLRLQQQQRLADARSEVNMAVESIARLDGGKQVLLNLIASEKQRMQANRIAAAVEEVARNGEVPKVVGPIEFLEEGK